MELADKGSLRQMLDRTSDTVAGKLPVQISLAHDIASGLAHRHSTKPLPCCSSRDQERQRLALFTWDESGCERLTAKIADFGLAVGVSGTSTAAKTARTKTHAAVGTFAYRAPETFSGTYTTSSEVYSSAIIPFELDKEKPRHRDAEGRPYMEATRLPLSVKQVASALSR